MHSAWKSPRPVRKHSTSSKLQGGRMVIWLIQGETGFWKGQCYSLCRGVATECIWRLTFSRDAVLK